MEIILSIREIRKPEKNPELLSDKGYLKGFPLGNGILLGFVLQQVYKIEVRYYFYKFLRFISKSRLNAKRTGRAGRATI